MRACLTCNISKIISIVRENYNNFDTITMIIKRSKSGDLLEEVCFCSQLVLYWHMKSFSSIVWLFVNRAQTHEDLNTEN